jgi:hypothetical protein
MVYSVVNIKNTTSVEQVNMFFSNNTIYLNNIT